MKREKLPNRKLFWVFGILILFGAIIVVASSLNNVHPQSVDVSDGAKHQGTACRIIVRNATKTIETECLHNVFFQTGAQATADSMQGGSGQNFTFIALCNATDPEVTNNCSSPISAIPNLTASGTVVQTAGNINYTAQGFSPFGVACGMQNKSGVVSRYSSAAGTGANWSVYATFTSTCANVITNVTWIMNASGTPFIGLPFTSVTLQSADQVTINASISNS